MVSPYDVLGVERDAADGEVVAAYRERAKDTHPDQGGSVEAFKRVRSAYEAIESGNPEDWNPHGPVTSRNANESVGLTPTRVEYLNFDVLSDHGWTLDDDALFEKAADADLDSSDYGEFVVQPRDSLLEAAERHGFAWPFACRGGACANCSVAVKDGTLAQPVDTILISDLKEQGFRLSCNGIPISDTLQVVYNVKHLPGLDELRLPPGPFEVAHADD